MPFRERIAWLSLLAMAVTYGPYFTVSTLNPPSAPLPDLRQLALFGATTVVQMLILAAGHFVIRLRWPDEARERPDERDRAIERRAITVAYYGLMAGAILVGVIMPFHSHGWSIVNAALLMIVGAEAVRYGVVVQGYRRG